MTAREIIETLRSDPEAAQLLELPSQVEQLREEMNARFDAMQEYVDQRFDAMQEYVDQRFDAMQEYVDQRFDAMQEYVDQRFDAVQEYVDQRFDRIEQRQDISDARLDRAEQRLDRIEKDLGYLKGRERERWFRDNAKNIFGRFMKRPQVVDLPDLEEILGENTLPQEHRDLLAEADLIVRGVGRDTQREVFAVLEASWKIDANDVERARKRAAVLRSYGLHAVPVVGGVETVEVFALPDDVAMFLDGKVHNAPLLR